MRDFIASFLISGKLKQGLSLVYDILSTMVNVLQMILDAHYLPADGKIKLEAVLRGIKVVRDFVGKVVEVFGVKRVSESRSFSTDSIHNLVNRLEDLK